MRRLWPAQGSLRGVCALTGIALCLESALGSTRRLDLACTPVPVHALQGRLLFGGEQARGGLGQVLD